jgi:TrmH RNA methyltransferase
LHICGLAAVQALLTRHPGRVERLFFEERFAAELALARRTLARLHRPYRQVEAAELARIAGTVHHGGVVAVARPQSIAALDPEAVTKWARDGRPLLILDGIANPHNLGAIIRSAAFFGVEHVVLAEQPRQALPSDASYRIAEGGLDAVNLYRAPIPDVLEHLKPAYRVLGTVAEGGAPLTPHRPGERPVALLLGNEETGLGAATLAACDAAVTIRGSGQVQSLNVAAAAAVLLYALTRG